MFLLSGLIQPIQWDDSGELQDTPGYIIGSLVSTTISTGCIEGKWHKRSNFQLQEDRIHSW